MNLDARDVKRITLGVGKYAALVVLFVFLTLAANWRGFTVAAGFYLVVTVFLLILAANKVRNEIGRIRYKQLGNSDV